jgi:hypothetical protein
MDDRPPRLRDQTGIRWALRIGGAISAVAGVVLIAMAIAGFVHASNDTSVPSLNGPVSDSAPKHFWLFFVGGPLFVLGVGMLGAGFMGAAARYTAGEVMPTVKDSLAYTGIRRRRRAAMCPFCGHLNPPGVGICLACQKPIPPGRR